MSKKLNALLSSVAFTLSFETVVAMDMNQSAVLCDSFENKKTMKLYEKHFQILSESVKNNSLSKMGLKSFEFFVEALERKESGIFVYFPTIMHSMSPTEFCGNESFVNLMIRSARAGYIENLAVLQGYLLIKGTSERLQECAKLQIDLASQLLEQFNGGDLSPQSNVKVAKTQCFFTKEALQAYKAEACLYLGHSYLFLSKDSDVKQQEALQLIIESAELGDKDSFITLGLLQVAGYMPIDVMHLTKFCALIKENYDFSTYGGLIDYIDKQLSKKKKNHIWGYLKNASLFNKEYQKFYGFYEFCLEIAQFKSFIKKNPVTKPLLLKMYAEKVCQFEQRFRGFYDNFPMFFFPNYLNVNKSQYEFDGYSARMHREIIQKIMEDAVSIDAWNIVALMEKPWCYFGRLQSIHEKGYENSLINLSKTVVDEFAKNKAMNIYQCVLDFKKLTLEDKLKFKIVVKDCFLKEDKPQRAFVIEMLLKQFDSTDASEFRAFLSADSKESSFIEGVVETVKHNDVEKITEIQEEKLLVDSKGKDQDKSYDESFAEKSELGEGDSFLVDNQEAQPSDKRKNKKGSRIKRLIPLSLRREGRDKSRHKDSHSQTLSKNESSQQGEQEENKQNLSWRESLSMEEETRKQRRMIRRNSMADVCPEISSSENEQKKDKRKLLTRRNTVAFMTAPQLLTISQNTNKKLIAYLELEKPSPADIRNALYLIHSNSLAKVRDKNNKIVITMRDGRAYVMHTHDKYGGEWSNNDAILTDFRNCIRECLALIQTEGGRDDSVASDAGEG